MLRVECEPAIVPQQRESECRGKNRGGDVMVLVCGPQSSTFDPPFSAWNLTPEFPEVLSRWQREKGDARPRGRCQQTRLLFSQRRFKTTSNRISVGGRKSGGGFAARIRARKRAFHYWECSLLFLSCLFLCSVPLMAADLLLISRCSNSVRIHHSAHSPSNVSLIYCDSDLSNFHFFKCLQCFSQFVVKSLNIWRRQNQFQSDFRRNSSSTPDTRRISTVCS